MANTFKFGNGIWATKKGSTLAYNDENGNYKPLPFNFERASGATRVNKDGLIEVVGNNKPRIDFKDSADGSLLLEPARTNLVTYSEAFDNAYWAKSGSSVTSGFISPDGTANAFKLVANSNNGYIDKQSISISNTTSYASSVYIKRIFGSGNVLIRDVNGNDVIKTITSEWEKHTVIATSNSTSGNFRITLANSGDEVLIYAAQLEQGSYPTSYIPTNGSAVTRVAEICNNGGNEQVINSTEGVWYYEMSTPDEQLKITRITDGTSSNYIILYSLSANSMRAVISVGGVVQFFFDAPVTLTNMNKFALRWNGTSYSYFVNGVNVANGAGLSFPINTLNNVSFLNEAGIYPFEGNVKDLRVYNTALTDVELEYMTSYRSLNEMVTELNLNAL